MTRIVGILRHTILRILARLLAINFGLVANMFLEKKVSWRILLQKNKTYTRRCFLLLFTLGKKSYIYTEKKHQLFYLYVSIFMLIFWENILAMFQTWRLQKIYETCCLKNTSTVLQIIVKISWSGWSEKSKSPRSYQIIGNQIKIFWLLFFCVVLRYICRTWNFLWYQNYIYVIVILVFYILFRLIKRFINVKIKRLIVF